MSLLRGLVCLALLAGLNAPAHANLRLSRFFIEAEQNARPQEVFVSNEGNETLYVKVEVEEVIDPQAEQPETRTGLTPEELGILVSPQRLVINPGEDKRIRVVTLDAPEEDRFFKVTVTPVVGDIESNTAIGVKLMIAYGIWVFARPEDAKPEIVAEVQDRDLILENIGGTHGEVRSIEFCPEIVTPDSGCSTLEGFRMMLGKTYTRSFEGPGRVSVSSMFKGEISENAYTIEK